MRAVYAHCFVTFILWHSLYQLLHPEIRSWCLICEFNFIHATSKIQKFYHWKNAFCEAMPLHRLFLVSHHQRRALSALQRYSSILIMFSIGASLLLWKLCCLFYFAPKWVQGLSFGVSKRVRSHFFTSLTFYMTWWCEKFLVVMLYYFPCCAVVYYFFDLSCLTITSTVILSSCSCTVYISK